MTVALQGIGSPPAAERALAVARAVGREIASRREAAALSRDGLSRRSGIGVGRIVAVEAGAADATLDTLVALGAALGVRFTDLLAITGSHARGEPVDPRL